MFNTDPEENRVQFRDRHTEFNIGTYRFDLVIHSRIVVNRRTRVPQVHLVSPADAVIGKVRIGLTESNRAIAAGGIDVETDRIAAAERSEERRVGKECRGWGASEHE